MRELSVIEAVREALFEEMARIPRAAVGRRRRDAGGVFRASEGCSSGSVPSA